MSAPRQPLRPGTPGETPGPRGDDDAFDWISSPLRRVRFGRMLVLAGPLGLAVALVLSLWVSTMHVRHSLIVQVESTWQPGERLGIRAQIVAARSGPIVGTRMHAAVEQGGVTTPLAQLAIVADGAGGEQSLQLPATLVPGPATLVLDVTADGVDAMHERIEVDVVADRPVRAPRPIVAGSTLQYGDDSDAQLTSARVVVRPAGRLLAGFDNVVFVRVTDGAGAPHVGMIEVALPDGEFMGKTGDGERPPVLFRGSPDALGLVRLEGPLGSEVLRLDVRLLDGGGAVTQHRLVRLVSFAGGVMASAAPEVVAPGDAIELKVWGLSAKLPIYVDVHGDDGAFVDVMTPPVIGREPPRPWTTPAGLAGVVQFEAHNQVTAPGESTAFVRVQVTQADPRGRDALLELVALQRAHADDARVERDYDAALERAFLDRIGTLTLDREGIARARGFLLGTLPPSIFGPPVAVATRPRLEQELLQQQGRWRTAMRVFLLGGGALFLGAMTLGMIRSHRRAAAATLAELGSDAAADPQGYAALRQQVQAAARAGILRGLGVVAIMVGGIALTMFILESLVWVF
ncbi:MAG: hypothetical protein U0168_26750 [Nannocystaceae bacterium]